MIVATAEQIRAMDRHAIQSIGIPGVVLMENAGRGAVCVLWRAFPDLAARRVLVLCGTGNNGGDGFVIARYLAGRGVAVDVYLAGDRSRVSGDARANLEILDRLGVPVTEVGTERGRAPGEIAPDAYQLVVDALLGTGLNAEVRGVLKELIQAVNKSPCPVMAVDIPSGLSADHGRPFGTCVRADLTVTFGLPKVGQCFPPGRDLCGKLWVVDIGIPRPVQEAEGRPLRLLEPGDFRDALPPRPPGAHKGDFGHLLVLAGSPGKTGAGAMASEAALRVGAGLVTLGIPKSLNLAMEARLTEVMTLPLPETSSKTLSREAMEAIGESLAHVDVVVIGPGITTQPETAELVLALAARVDKPMVIDADGLNALAGHLEVLSGSAAPRILTPHPGEMGRLLGMEAGAVQADRIGYCRELAIRLGAYVVLKGAGTVIAAPGGGAAIVPTGGPALATAGTGDVLAGMIGGLLCQGMDPFEAAGLGAYLHGWIADEWAESYGSRGLLATDLLDRIPGALRRALGGEIPRRWPEPAGGCPLYV